MHSLRFRFGTFGLAMGLLTVSAGAFAAQTAATKGSHKARAHKTVRATELQAPLSGVEKSEMATAETRSTSPFKGNLQVEPNFGFAFVSPKDVNAVITDMNSAVQKQGMKSFQAPEFGSVAAFGLAATYRVHRDIGVGLGFNRMSSTSESSASQNNVSLIGEFNISANLLTAETRFTVLRAMENKLEGLVSPFVGIAWYGASENFSGSALQNSQEVEASSNGVVFGSTVGARYWVLEQLAAGLQFGYRYAKSGDLKVTSQKNTSYGVGNTLDNGGKKVQLDMASFILGANVSWSI